jgi:dienelactone hydrolase
MGLGRILAAAAALAITTGTLALAQTPAAPVLKTDKDVDGRPLPFGRRPHQPNDTPLGSGPFKAVMADDPSLPAHTLYYPADLAKAGKLPVIAWGNGACINAGNRFRDFLTDIASHGYLAIANGPIAAVGLEVGPQENPAVRKPGEAPPPPPPQPAAGAGGNTRAPGTTTAQQLVEAIDWAAKENERQGSRFFHRLDLSKVAVMGQSCGGVQALSVASDPRITTMMIWSSGVGMIPNNPTDPDKALAAIHTPIAFIYGDQEHDIAYPAATMNAQRVKVPAFGAWQTGMTHLGTYGQENGGYFAKIAEAWLGWRLKGDAAASKMFVGADCTLCRDPNWHVTQRGLQ